MKKLSVLLLAICLFVSCNNKDIDIDKALGKNRYKFAETNLSAIEVLSSAELWQCVNFCFYTKPDGKGKKMDPSKYVGFSVPRYAFTSDTMTSYLFVSSIPYRYYVEHPLEIVDDNMLLYDADHKDDIYIKILDYDEEVVYIETNGYRSFSPDDDIEYGYARMYLKRSKFYYGEKDTYHTYEEYLKYKQEKIIDS